MLKLPFKIRADGLVADKLTPSMPGLANNFAVLILCVGAFAANAQDFGSSQPQLVLPQQDRKSVV